MKTLLNKNVHEGIPEILPVIPTIDVVVFPNMLVPLLVLDEKIINGINKSLESSKMALLLAARKQSDNGAIGTKDLYDVGTVATIMRLIKVPEGGVKILVQGVAKARAMQIMTDDDNLTAVTEKVEMLPAENKDEVTAQIRNIKATAEKMAMAGTSASPDFHLILSKMQDPEKIADFILSHLNLEVEDAQKLLEAKTLLDFLGSIYQHLNKEIELSEIQEKIRNHARESMNKAQKEYYLREQMKAIKKELGEDDLEEIEAMHTKIAKLDMPEESKAEVKRQIERLEKTASDSMEAAVIRNYLEWVYALPWGIETIDNLELAHAKQVLDADHYGLNHTKDRILDFISIRTLKKDGYAPILCLVGPPGTGKTSLGQSIARSLGKKYARISLGGVKDEAEIRGHRRTYVGAMPGRFIQALRKAGSCNPVIVIDEIDKIGADFRGDPSAAMLEVLDPQQNKTFYDNYLGMPFDLSQVMFIATANSLDTISGPLRDRMEVIEFSGYAIDEKLNIAKRHIMPKVIESAGLSEHASSVTFSDKTIEDLVVNYTQESGVRQLERVMSKLCSKAARSFVEDGKIPNFNIKTVEKHLGPRRFIEEDIDKVCQVGITNALAWTASGGEVLKIEAMLMPGRGKFILTGQLGDIMKESAQAALSYARAHSKEFNIQNNLFTNYDLHIHVPAGAVPKDGPSAGITMLSSILSALTDRPIDAHYAMTGELNLRGEIMPIGGVREKILAAKRNNITHVILPHKNKNDLIGMEDVAKGIDLIWARSANEVLSYVLMPKKKQEKKSKQL